MYSIDMSIRCARAPPLPPLCLFVYYFILLVFLEMLHHPFYKSIFVILL